MKVPGLTVLADPNRFRGFRHLGVWNYGLSWGSAPDPGIL